jgi:hypothetical protein
MRLLYFFINVKQSFQTPFFYFNYLLYLNTPGVQPDSLRDGPVFSDIL